MTPFSRLVVVCALLSGAMEAMAGGVSTSSTQSGHIGEVIVADSRIVDISGSYKVGQTSFNIIQDGRGRLISSVTVIDDDGTTAGPFPAVGAISVHNKKGVYFKVYGRISVAAETSDTASIGRGHHNRGRSRNTKVYNMIVKIEGRQQGLNFLVTSYVKGIGKGSSVTGIITPQNPARGAVIADAAGTTDTLGRYVTSRIVTLPWGTTVGEGLEKATGTGRVKLRVNAETSNTLAVNGRFRADLEVRPTSTGFSVRSSRITVGYGTIDADRTTSVTASAL